MEELTHLIKEVVERCAAAKTPVSQVLAAFVIRTLVESDPVRYALDKQLAKDDICSLIDNATDKLLTQDDPALETIKMQVEFDSAYFEEEQKLEETSGSRERRIKEMMRRVIQNRPKHGTDFDTINTIYKDIFKFVIMDHHPEGLNDKAAEREVAAALESVFPRIGVRAFTQLSSAEKKTQLSELSHVVLGIRLLNRAMDKGGAGIHASDKDVEKLLNQLKDSIAKEVEFLMELCLQYQETLVYAHMTQLRNSPSAEALATVDRLKDELANRRQFHAYLQSVQEDVLVSSRRAEGLLTRFRAEMGDLRDLVGGRSTVPKEHVYPRFDSLAVMWQQLEEELRVLQARSLIYGRLANFRGSFRPIFNSRLPLFKAAVEHQQASSKRTMEEEAELAAAAAGASTAPDEISLSAEEEDNNNRAGEGVTGAGATREPAGASQQGGGQRHAGKDADKTHGGGGGAGGGVAAGGAVGSGTDQQPASEEKVVLNKEQELWYVMGQGTGKVEVKDKDNGDSRLVGPDKPVKLSMASTPEFMQLPLEYQGFCSWTILNRRGLLLPGKPALGVVRFRNAFYVFAHEVALRHFMKHPEEVVSGMKKRAAQSPELIHLLRMQDSFPETSIRSILKGKGRQQQPQSGQHAGHIPGLEVKDKADAGTETPLHFVERHKDYSYQWNEWQLRRRALQVVKLRKCRTMAQQTDASHFRRENDSQVYPPKAQSTQTNVARGTNPPRTFTYLAGLRHSEVKELGQPGPLHRPSRFVCKDAKEVEDDRPGIVELTFEHEWEPTPRRRPQLQQKL